MRKAVLRPKVRWHSGDLKTVRLWGQGPMPFMQWRVDQGNAKLPTHVTDITIEGVRG
jgi:hypothetical protein